MQQPTVCLRIGDSYIAKAPDGEVLEATELVDGQPDWTNAGVCDARGAAGPDGVRWLSLALDHGERNAMAVGYQVRRVQA